MLQYNKRDLPETAAAIDELNQALNVEGVPSILAVASRGDGVFDTFREVSKLLLRNLSKNLGPAVLAKPAVRPAAQAPPAPRAAAPVRAEASPHASGPPRAPADPPRAPAEFPRVFAEPPRTAVETPHAMPVPVAHEAPRVEMVTMRSEVVAAPKLQPEMPRVERIDEGARFIVSDPPMRAEAAAERALAPTIEPVRASEPAGPLVLEPQAAETATEPLSAAPEAVSPDEGVQGGRKDNGKSENGRSKGGFFGWLRRPKNGQEIEQPPRQVSEETVVPVSSSHAIEAPPEIGEGEDLLTATQPGMETAAEAGMEMAPEPFMETASEPALGAAPEPFMETAAEPGLEMTPEPVAQMSEEPDLEMETEPAGEIAQLEGRPHLELLRGTRDVAGSTPLEAAQAFAVPVHEITVPVVLPSGCGEVRLVVRLLVSRTAQEPEALESGFEEPRAARTG